MRVYEEVEGNILNIYNVDKVSNTTTTRKKDLNQPVQIKGVKVQENYGKDLKTLKTTSKNVEK